MSQSELKMKTYDAVSPDFQVKLALEETIRHQSEQIYKLKNSMTSKSSILLYYNSNRKVG